MGTDSLKPRPRLVALFFTAALVPAILGLFLAERLFAAEFTIGVAVGSGLALAMVAGICLAIGLTRAAGGLQIRIDEHTREIEVARDRERGLNQELAQRNDELTRKGAELESQRRELEEKTRQGEEIDRLKNAFIANMSHEIRTPLNSVLALSQLLRDGMAGAVTAEQRRYVEVIERNGQNLLRLINDILDLSRIKSGHFEMDLQATDLAAQIRAAAGALRPLADAKGLDLVVKLPNSLPLVRCDPDRVRQVLTNLVGNAVKFTEHGHVLLSAEETGEGVAVHVTDTGIGIPDAARARIFEEFFQVDPTLARRGGGTGLGLAIASQLVTLMGGRLNVTSVVGAGSRFTFTLPRSDAQVEGAPDGPEATAPDLEGAVLLAAPDNQDGRRLATQLEGAGLKVDAAGGLTEATGKLRARRYDVAVVDLDLPDDAGFALVDEIRRSERAHRVPVLGLSARDLGATERERLSPPVVGLIRKGEDVRGALTASLRRALAARVVGPATDGGIAAPPRDAKVLVVEDNEDNIFTLRQILAPLGLDVVTVSTGRDAIEYCRARLPDLVLMDVQLPGMSGLQATGAIRKLPGGMTIPIVALTAQAMKGDRERILAAGCDDYLSKPVLPKTLLGVVQRYLAQRDRDAAESASSASRHSTQRQSEHGTNPGRR